MLRISLLHSQFLRHYTIIKGVSKHDFKYVCGIALITKAYIICHFSIVMYILFMAMETYIYIHGELLVLFSISTKLFFFFQIDVWYACSPLYSFSDT